MTAVPTEAGPSAIWMQMLEQIEEAVERRLAQVEEPARADADARPATKTPLQILDERLAQMRARLDHAERDAAQADAALLTESQAYQHWTESMTAARRRLADWAARGA